MTPERLFTILYVMENLHKLTPRQKDIFDFIIKYCHSNSKPPTFREIGEQFDIKSTNGVKSFLVALEKKGFLKVLPRISRGIQISTEISEQDLSDVVKVPVLGTVAAGRPILAEENYSGSLNVDQSIVGRNRSVFALKVRGDSMTGVGIMPNDMVIVQQTKEIKNGDIVVAIIDFDATVKRFRKDGNRIFLEAENENYPPIILEPDRNDLQIAGKVIAVLRKY